MLINWFTVGAQALNFLVLVWLLKRFLYKPILDAVDAREQRIAAALADASAKEADAGKEREAFQQKNQAFDQQRATLLATAIDEAKGERQRLMDEARQTADALSAKRQDALRADARTLNDAISRRTQQEVFAIARKALTDLATSSLEERVCDEFIRRLRAMDDPTKAALGEALDKASEPALVRSAFDLPAGQRAAIQTALNDTYATEIRVTFETAPALVSGIELTAHGEKVGWSIAEYLTSLERGVAELLKQKATTDAPAPSDLSRRIGKRAYELYETEGHQEGHATQDWETAEREIRQESRDPAKTEADAEAESQPKDPVMKSP